MGYREPSKPYCVAASMWRQSAFAGSSSTAAKKKVIDAMTLPQTPLTNIDIHVFTDRDGGYRGRVEFTAGDGEQQSF